TAGEGAATTCANPTRTLTGGSSDVISLAAGETVLLTGGAFTGGVAAFPQGSVLCVSPSASFAPPYANNASGTLVVQSQGSAQLPWLTVSNGFQLINAGTTEGQGLTAAGTARLENTADGTLRFPSGLALNSQSVLINAGTATTGSLNVSADSTVINTGALASNGSGVALNGELDNSGTLTIQQYLTASASSRVRNSCTIAVSAGWAAAGSAVNQGLITLGSDYLNNTGTLSQSTEGQISGVSFANSSDGAVSGFGGYRFTGNTTNFGTFSGDSATSPIAFYDTTQTGTGIFDTPSGTITHTVRTPVIIDPDRVPSGCSNQPAADSADLYVYKTGPAAVTIGGQVTYTVTAANIGPDTAAAATVTDTLPASGLTGVTASGGGTVDGTTVTWQAGDIEAGTAVSYTVTGTATAVGTLLDIASGTSTTDDPTPANNDGSADHARINTVVTDPMPVNNPPVMADQAFVTQVDRKVFGQLAASDPDTGQTLTFSLPADASEGALNASAEHGEVMLAPNGLFEYTPAPGFAGRDAFPVQVCDNGTPVLCAQATVTVTVEPVAVDYTVTTESGIPETIDVTQNDRGITSAPVAVTQPTHGTLTTGEGETFLYTSDADYTGPDSYTYRICSISAPDVCDEATVRILVLPRRIPPIVGDVHTTTLEGVPVAGQVPVSDPQGERVVTRLGVAPPHGTATVTAQGAYVFTPDAGFTGTTSFTVIGCTITAPPLCDTGTVYIEVTPSPSPSPTPTP
ncbi:Ig-like domain-containing protein, partial [Streptomyces beijiangensis]